MLDQTIRQIEERIANSPNMSDDARDELKTLLATLKAEVETLAETNADDAERIRQSAADAADPDSEGTFDGLSDSVRDFEATHPRLAQTVHNICNMLASIGI